MYSYIHTYTYIHMADTQLVQQKRAFSEEADMYIFIYIYIYTHMHIHTHGTYAQLVQQKRAVLEEAKGF